MNQTYLQNTIIQDKIDCWPEPQLNSPLRKSLGVTPITKKISLIIPAYNEDGSIEKVIESIKDIDCIKEVIVIDDGSTDNTYNKAVKTGIKVIKHNSNKGYGAAIKTGIRAASGDIIITMDADLQHSAEDVKRISHKMIDNNYDMLIGIRDNKSHSPLLRRPGKFILAKLVNYLAGYRIPDINSGLRAIRKDLLIKMSPVISNGFSFSTTSTLVFLKEGYEVGNISITASKRNGNNSQVRIVKDGINTIILILRIIMLFDPFKIFLPVSSILFLLGLIYGLISVVMYFHIPSGSVLFMLSGLLLFCIGLVADQISALRMQSGIESK